MPVEPGLVDTNVLVYALDADAAQHASSRALLEAGRAASVTLYVDRILRETIKNPVGPEFMAPPPARAGDDFKD
jgi:predicted nucleic acid-binding protein